MALLKYFLVIILLLSILWALSKLIKTANFQLFVKVCYVLLSFLIFLEISLNIIFRVESGTWIFQLNKHPNSALFENHPYLSVSNRKDIQKDLYGIQISHNKSGQRGREYSQKTINSAKRIVTIGGSTTYGVGVNDWETWPYLLDSLAGKDTIVINLSVPGHTTVEHLISASLYLDKYNPDIIIIHAGLNDLRVSHVKNLNDDYSNFHEPNLRGSMGLCYLESVPKVATIYYTVQLMQKMKIYPICSFHSASFSGELSSDVDEKALRIYKKNLSKLIYICKYYTSNIIVVPQVLVVDNLKGNILQWWIPYISSDALPTVLNEYNKTSKQAADFANCIYLDEMLDYDWNSDNFSDAIHLNKTGNEKLADMIYNKFELFNKAYVEDSSKTE